MKFIICGLALVACVMADVSELGYDYHAPAPVEHQHHEHQEVIDSLPELPNNNYLPSSLEAPAPEYQSAPVAPNSYLPPTAPAATPIVSEKSYIPPAVPSPGHEAKPAPTHVPDTGLVGPQNSYIPPDVEVTAPVPAPVPFVPQTNSYLPPTPAIVHESVPTPIVPQTNTYIPPAAEAPAEQTAEFADDGYHYRTVRRRVYRYRS